MPLQAGTRLGPYEILSAVGAGGMGEVYKARDTRLERTVALKVIQPAVAASREMRERFEREARAISALDHPHICTLYDVAREGEISFLVMQYLEGESLADRLATASKGPIPFDTALRYAAEIAHALDTAHRRGIVHRDLKPGNVMLTKTGTKLLDFGLAKLTATGDTDGIFGAATRTAPFGEAQGGPLTSRGTILGTLHYMSPEQLEGRDVDARSDIHAFGALLYEMLSGRRAFEAKSEAGVIAAIVGGEPQPLGRLADGKTTLPVVAQRGLDRLLARCLAKNPDDRWQSAADLAAELQWIAEERLRAAPDVPAPAITSAAPSRSRERFWIGLACVLAIALAAVAYVWYPRPQTPQPRVMFTIPVPDGQTLAPNSGLLALSPDGSKVAFVTGPSSATQLWVRPLNSLNADRLDRADAAWNPVWSPNGGEIAFGGTGGLSAGRSVDLATGAVRQVAASVAGRVAWGRSGVILFTGADGKLYRVPEVGGAASLAMNLDSSRKETRLDWPLFLPDGRRYLFLAVSADSSNTGLFLASLDSADRTWLVNVLSSVEYAPGHLFYQLDGRVMAHPFDAASGRLTGDAFPVLEDVDFNSGNGRTSMSVSETGTLAYVASRFRDVVEGRSLLLTDRTGTALRTLPGRYTGAALSPDGRQAIVSQAEGRLAPRKLVLIDLERGVPTPFTTGDADERSPVWAPDGSFVVFHSRREKSGLYRRGAGGGATTDELLWPTNESVTPSGFSRDGQRLLFSRGEGRDARIWMLPLTGDRTPIQVFPGSTRAQFDARFSPDDKWIAYTEWVSNRVPQISVQPYPPDSRHALISTAVGGSPRWSYDGRQIMYREGGGTIVTVALSFDGGTIRPAPPRPVFPKPLTGTLSLSYRGDASSERFLFIIESPEKPVEEPATITVILNFAQSVAKK